MPAALADRIGNTRDGVQPVNSGSGVTNYWTLGPVPASGTFGTSITAPIMTAYVGEIFVPANMTITGLALLNGATFSGNVQLSLYDTAGNLLGSTASTAQAGASALQSIALSSPITVNGPARYFVAAQFSSATATFMSVPLGVGKASTITAQIYGTLMSPLSSLLTGFAASSAPVVGTY